jgi:hypothetical protein
MMSIGAYPLEMRPLRITGNANMNHSELRPTLTVLKNSFSKEDSNTCQEMIKRLERHIYKSDWIIHDTGLPPSPHGSIDRTTDLEYVLRNGQFGQSGIRHLDWSLHGGDTDIVKYRFLCGPRYTMSLEQTFSEVLDIIKAAFESENSFPFYNAVNVIEYMLGIHEESSWIENTGERPKLLHRNQKVEIMMGDDFKYTDMIMNLKFRRSGGSSDIIRYRLIPSLLT